MTSIPVSVRSFEAGDLQGVVDLYRNCFIGVALRPRPEVERKLAQLFVDGPLCDERLPSVVACDAEGRVVGFRGHLRRWWRLGDERLFGSTGTAFMVQQELRRKGISMAMRLEWRRIEAETGGVRDVSYGDRATPDGRAFGTSDPERRTVDLEHYGFEWSLPLRPRAQRVLRKLSPRLPAGAPRRWLLNALRGGSGSPSRPGPRRLRSTPLSAAALQEAIEAAGRDRALRLDESPETWTWLLDYLSDYPSRGRFSGRVFLTESGSPLGFSAGYLNDVGGWELLGFATPYAMLEEALDDVLREAAAAGALFVFGAAFARDLRPLLERGAVLEPGGRATIRSRRDDVVRHFEAMDVLLTGLESERWL
jgi:hypothetical protein